MASQKEEKINKEMKKIFAQFIERESNRNSLITVTRCKISKDLKHIKVFVSVLPEEEEAKALAFLERRKWDARDYMKKRIRIRILPFVEFLLDQGEKNRQKIDQLLKKV